MSMNPCFTVHTGKGSYLDFPDLVKLLLEMGEKVTGLRSEDYWLDIGRREDYEIAQVEFASRATEFDFL